MARRAALALIGILAAPGWAVPAAAEPALVSHRAVYDMHLDRAAAGSGITGISGRLAFEMIGTPCAGYSVNMRFVSQIESNEATTASDLRSSTFETADGDSFRFESRSYFDDELAENTQGIALRDEDGIAVALSEPESVEASLPRDVLFPSQHIRAIIDAAEAGQTMFRARIFDGSDTGRDVYDTTTVIGGRRDGSAEVEAEGALDLMEAPSWPVTVAYFDDSGGEAETPKYEFSYDLHANGVSSEVVLDYGEFAMRGDLTSLERVETDPCETD